MRRNLYLGFGVILLVIALLFVLMNSFIWFIGLLIVLGVIFIYDVTQKHHAILRNFPILGHIRFILEGFGPEIRQYFIADDQAERPFDREQRSMIYQRAKKLRDTVPFGTERDILATGYQWVLHSLNPKKASEVEDRILIGHESCRKPYLASRLNISAMSFGALSTNAILAMNKGAKIGNFYHNTGEGGLSDHHLAGGGDVVWQIGTGYFGCRNERGGFDADKFEEKATLDVVKMIEIKLSQGAKPSHGGILPAAKVTEEIARIRGVPMGQDVISPPAHTAFSTPEGLLRFLQELRDLSGGKPVGFKLCIGKREEFLSICKAMLKTKIIPDFITVDGAEGGTGAAPPEFSNNIGAPLHDGLLFVNNALVGVGVRDQVRVIASGKVASGFDMVTKIALGADLCNCARAMMLSVGCIQSRQCNTNGCPTGVATQDPRLAKGLVVETKKIHVAQFHEATIDSFLDIIGAMGYVNPSDLDASNIMRRIAPGNVKNYREIYEYLDTGDLLKDVTRKKTSYNDIWNKASAEAF